MDNRRRTSFKPEEFQDEPKGSVGDHVNRVDLAVAFSCQNLASENDQQHHIEYDLHFPGGPADVFQTWNQRSEAAPGKDTVDPGTHNGKNHADGENVEHLRGIPFCQLRSGPIGQRHEEDAAKQAHVPKAFRIEAGLQKGKDFDTEDADQGV